jgi:hypothetical protein
MAVTLTAARTDVKPAAFILTDDMKTGMRGVYRHVSDRW